MWKNKDVTRQMGNNISLSSNIKELEKSHIDIRNCIGPAYDGAAALAFEKVVVAAFIKIVAKNSIVGLLSPLHHSLSKFVCFNNNRRSSLKSFCEAASKVISFFQRSSKNSEALMLFKQNSSSTAKKKLLKPCNLWFFERHRDILCFSQLSPLTLDQRCSANKRGVGTH